jgi:hypothetical protein
LKKNSENGWILSYNQGGKMIRVPTPAKLTVSDDEQAEVEVYLLEGTCVVSFTGLDADTLSKQYYNWLSNPDAEE